MFIIDSVVVSTAESRHHAIEVYCELCGENSQQMKQMKQMKQIYYL